MKRVLTHKQQVVLEFIQRYLAENRCAPIIREIQAGCQIVSYKSAIDRLNALERKGCIKRIPNKHRSIKLVKPTIQEPKPEAHEVQEAASVQGTL